MKRRILRTNPGDFQVGQPNGLLAQTNGILRLNTVGGVAPAGPCDAGIQPKAEVPYQADYLFVHAAN